MKIKQKIKTAIAIVSLAATALSANAATYLLNAKIKSPRGTYKIVNARVSDTEPGCIFIRTPYGHTTTTPVKPILYGYDGRTPVFEMPIEFKDYAWQQSTYRVTLGGFSRSCRTGKISGCVAGAGFSGTFTLKPMKVYR